MAEKDITQKMLEQYNDVFMDIVNVLLFNGEMVVREDDLIDLPTNSSKKIGRKINYQDRDVAKYWQGNKINIAMFGIENQTDPDKLMPLRVISYDGAEYGRQSSGKNKDKPKYPVITLVLYMGHKGRWNYPKNIMGIVDVDERLKPYVNDYKINLFEIAYLPEEKRKLFKSDFRVVVDYLYQVRKNNKYEPKMYKIEHIDEVLNLMSAMTSDNRFEEVIEEAHEKEAKYMCEVIDIMLSKGWQEAIDSGLQQGLQKGLQQGLEEGMQKGLEEGMQKGLEEGMQKGLEEGRQEGIVTGVELEKKNIAQSMKKKGFDISLIMELTGLTKEKILSL